MWRRYPAGTAWANAPGSGIITGAGTRAPMWKSPGYRLQCRQRRRSHRLPPGLSLWQRRLLQGGLAAHGGGDAAASVQMTAVQSESGIPTGRAQKRGWSILTRCSSPFVMVPKAALSLSRDGCGRPRDLCTTARDGTCRCRDSSRIRRSRSSLPYDAFCCRRRGPRWQRTRPARSDL